MYQPFTNTSASRNTPSNSSQSRWPASSFGKSNFRRYHATLLCGNPGPTGLNPCPPSALESNGNSTAQSCGKFTVRQVASPNDALAGPPLDPALSRCNAFGQSSPRWNFQPKSIDVLSRGDSAARAAATIRKIAANLTARDVNFMRMLITHSFLHGKHFVAVRRQMDVEYHTAAVLILAASAPEFTARMSSHRVTGHDVSQPRKIPIHRSPRVDSRGGKILHDEGVVIVSEQCHLRRPVHAHREPLHDIIFDRPRDLRRQPVKVVEILRNGPHVKNASRISVHQEQRKRISIR